MNKIRYTTSTLALLTGCVIMMTGNAFAMPQDELPARKSIQYNGGQFTCQVDKTFNEAAGKMKSIGGTWAIVTSEGGRVLAIDVKDAFKVDGLDVIFSGYRGTPPPNVRLIASPFELVSIRKKGDPRPKVDKPKQVLPANLPKNPDEMIKMLANRKNAKVAVAAIDQHCRKDKSSRDQMIKQLLNVTRSDKNMLKRGWAIAALAKVGGEDVDKQLMDIHADGEQKMLVRTWAGAARVLDNDKFQGILDGLK